MRLNLGCGKEYMAGWINIDSDKTVKSDRKLNLDQPLMLWGEDDSVDEVYGKYIIEHIKNDQTFFNWLYRICKNGATLTFLSPLFPDAASIDWDHKSFWNRRKLEYLNKDNRDTYMGLNCDFVIRDYSEWKENGSVVFKVVLETRK